MSAATMAPLRTVHAFEAEKRHDRDAYRDMTLLWELGTRAYQALKEGTK